MGGSRRSHEKPRLPPASELRVSRDAPLRAVDLARGLTGEGWAPVT